MKKYFFVLILFSSLSSCTQNRSTKEEPLMGKFDETMQEFEIQDGLITFSTIVNDTISTKVILETGCKGLLVDKEFFDMARLSHPGRDAM